MMTTEELRFRVFFTGSNMPGYMPDEPPYPCASAESARESLLWDIGRDIDNATECGDDVAELERFYSYCENCEFDDIGGTVGNRHYFVMEDVMSADELRDRDCEPCEYSPIIGDYVSPEVLDELQAANVDVDIVSAEYRHDPSDDDGWRTVHVIDDWGMSGKLWRIGKTDCGAWLHPDAVIRADSFCSAWEAWIDERPTIDADDVHEAYGAFDRLVDHLVGRGHGETQHMKDFANRYAADYFAIDTKRPDAVNDWDLIEGYEYQSSASGTGIVIVGYDDRLDDVPEGCLRFKVKV